MTGIKVCLFALFFFIALSYGQDRDNDDKYSPIKLNLNESGSKFMRLIFCNQIQAGYSDIGKDNSKAIINVRRARMLAFGRFSPKFLLLLHIGTHYLNAQSAGVAGKGSADIFVNDAWGEYMLFDQKLYFGAGIHYWGGISRMQRSSTFKFLAIDNFNSRTWLNYGRTGQFVREFGFYIKGKHGKVEYAASINDSQNGYAVAPDAALNPKTSIYGGSTLLARLNDQSARYNYTVRLEYQFLKQESHMLPFKTGSTYSKTGEIFNIGAGMVYHPNGAVILKGDYPSKTIANATLDDVKFEDAIHFAVDAFLDYHGWTAYALYQNTNYGINAGINATKGTFPSRFTGSNITLLTGYMLSDRSKISVQPYTGMNFLIPSVDANFRGIAKSGLEFTLGANLFFVGTFLKVSVEYQKKLSPYLDKGLMIPFGGKPKKAQNNMLLQMQFLF